MKDEIYFKDVKPIEEHFRILYSFLSDRKHNISHRNIPTYDEHVDFVKKHPYRKWVIVESESKVLGSLYIHTDNSIGINFDPKYIDLFPRIFKMITKRWRPLPEILSVRNKHFFVNIPSSNDALISVLKTMGAKHLQSSFVLDEH